MEVDGHNHNDLKQIFKSLKKKRSNLVSLSQIRLKAKVFRLWKIS